MKIIDILNENIDIEYKIFNEKLIPTIEKDKVLGIRVPTLRKIYRELGKSPLLEEFLKELPHAFHEENILHAIAISEMKDYSACIKALNIFLPYIDNWAVCDILSPKIFKKNLDSLYNQICKWLLEDDVYTIRFAIVTLMSFYLDDAFKKEHIDLLVNIKKRDYYIDMAIAWYMATALFKQYETALEYLEGNKFDIWIHNKSIQKAIESNRIKSEIKDYLRTLKRTKE